MGIREELLAKELDLINIQIKQKENEVDSLKKEVQFQQSAVLNCCFAEFLDDGFVIKPHYNDGFILKDNNQRNFKFTIIFNPKQGGGSIVDLKLDLESKYYTQSRASQEDELNLWASLGKMSEKVLNEKDEIIQLFDEISSETTTSFNELKEKMIVKQSEKAKISEELKEIRFGIFIKDLEDGVEFGVSVTLNKKQNHDLYPHCLKITGYTPSGMTARIAYGGSRYVGSTNKSRNEDSKYRYKNEVMTYKLREMFDQIYWRWEQGGKNNLYKKHV